MKQTAFASHTTTTVLICEWVQRRTPWTHSQIWPYHWLIARESNNIVSSVSISDHLESDHKAVPAGVNHSKPLQMLRLGTRGKLLLLHFLSALRRACPCAPWHTTQTSQDKRKRRQAECRWRSTKLTPPDKFAINKTEKMQCLILLQTKFFVYKCRINKTKPHNYF